MSEETAGRTATLDDFSPAGMQAAIDARMRETQPRGTFRSREEYERESAGDARAAEEPATGIGLAEEKAPAAREAGLRGRTYSALFRADLQPETITFYVEDKECSITLLRMEQASFEEYLRRGGADPDSETFKSVTEFLVGATVIDYLLWQRVNGQWQQLAPPQGAKPEQRVAALRSYGGGMLREFWDDLFAEVVRVNAARSEDQGN